MERNYRSGQEWVSIFLFVLSFRLPEVFRIAIFRIAASRYCWNSIESLSEDYGSVEENVF